MEELSVASQKAASVANTVGVDMDQFAGHIAAIEATTREAPENIGNGLKTLYSRIADIKLGETLEDGVDLGQFSTALKKVGVDVLDTSGQMRQVGDIMEDIMAQWNEMSQTQQNAVATTVAGRYQLARFEALMNSQDIYKTALGAAQGEIGTETYDRMQEDYRNSLEGRSKAFQASIEEIFLKAFDTDSFYALVDVSTQLVKVFGDLIEAVGGGGAAITAFGALLMKGFSKNIGAGIGNFISNRQTAAMQESNRNALVASAQNQLMDQGISTGNSFFDSAANDIAGMNQYRNIMTKEQDEETNNIIQRRIELIQQEIDLEGQLKEALIVGNASREHSTGESIASTEELLEYLRQLKVEYAEITKEDVRELPGIKESLNDIEKVQGALKELSQNLDAIKKAQQAGVGEDIA